MKRSVILIIKEGHTFFDNKVKGRRNALRPLTFSRKYFIIL